MTVADVATNFVYISYNYDPTNWKQSYWLAIGNGDTFGVNGTSKYCGSTCKRNVFNITSPVTQTVYINANLHNLK